ncbi:MAG: hypothetical protein AOA66_1592 [Candidatus Bathyarchaeota archaeon BA2]|nr:MAG: hypothetical protein AOA66_1592 [Candidatus Bathyarchaeota archaeon BA2]
MPKRATIKISLVKEADEKANEEIEKQIFEYLREYPPKIPWLKNVEEVTVTEV